MSKELAIDPSNINSTILTIGNFDRIAYTYMTDNEKLYPEKIKNSMGDFQFFTYSKELSNEIIIELKELDRVILKDNRIINDVVFYNLQSIKQFLQLDHLELRLNLIFGKDIDFDLIFLLSADEIREIVGKNRCAEIMEFLKHHGISFKKIDLNEPDWKTIINYSPKNYMDLLKYLSSRIEGGLDVSKEELYATLEENELVPDYDYFFQNESNVNSSVEESILSIYDYRNIAQKSVIHYINNFIDSIVLSTLFSIELLTIDHLTQILRKIVVKLENSLYPHNYSINNFLKFKSTLFKSNKFLEIEKNNELDEIIRMGESRYVEFKSTMRFDLRTNQISKDREKDILRTIAGFQNTDGGTLIIGVEDDGKILGIEKDGFKNHDKFLLHLDNLINSHLKPTLSLNYESYIRNIYNNNIAIIRVKSSPFPIFLKWKSDEEFFIRSGPNTRKLSASEIVSYVNNRFKNLN